MVVVGMTLALDGSQVVRRQPSMSNAPIGRVAEAVVQEHAADVRSPARLPIEREHRYVVSARIRPLLLFWIGRDNVGTARLIRRRGNEGERGAEVLIGSDPDRAPRRINRWGFISETTRGASTDVLGVMTDSSERSLDEAKARVSREQESGKALKVLQSLVEDGRVVSRASVVRIPDAWTYRDVDRVLSLIEAQPTTTKTMAFPAGADGGFLTALFGVLPKLLEPCQHAASELARPVPPVVYPYNATMFRLSVDSCVVASVALQATGTTVPAVDVRFSIQNLTTKNVTRFRLAYGSDGELAGIPVRVVFRPQWWVEVDLTLDDGVMT